MLMTIGEETEDHIREINSDPERPIIEFCQAYERAKHLLDDPRIIRFYREDLQEIARHLVDKTC